VTTIRRRDFAKGMIAVAASAKALLGQQETAPAAATPQPVPPTALAPMPLSGGLEGVGNLPVISFVPDEVAETSAHFFNATQMVTLRRLSEILAPPWKGHPGALEAGAPEFLDFLIGASGAERQQMYQSGLDRLNEEANSKFSVSFADLKAAQADELIRPWMRTWMPDHPPTEPFARFINLANSDIRAATVNSQAWHESATAAGKQPERMELYWYPVDPDIHQNVVQGCDATGRKNVSGRSLS
jgi:hypothetical protein